jgi:hypothetical protein
MRQSLTVLSVAFPFAPVGRDPVGGAEQVLRHIDRALVTAGHRSIVVAEEGSQIAGTLISIPAQRGFLSEATRELSYRSVREVLGRVLQAEPVDVVHMHGFDFHSYLPAFGPLSSLGRSTNAISKAKSCRVSTARDGGSVRWRAIASVGCSRQRGAY